MNIKHVGTGAEATLFTDIDAGEDYVVTPCEYWGWEHLYSVISASDGQVIHNIDGATAEEALRNYLEHGQGAMAQFMTVYCNGICIDRMRRPGCDTEYKVRGVPIVFTVKKGATGFEWRVVKEGSDERVTVQAGSPAEAVLQYIDMKGEHNV